MKHKKFIIGNAIGISLLSAILIAVNVVALGTDVRQLITTYLGGSGLKKQGDNITDSYANASKVVDEIMDEGVVLLKNQENALPLAKPNTTNKIKVNLFGYNTINTYYGGSGSGASAVDDAETYVKSYEDANFEVNSDLIKLMEDNAGSVDSDIGNPLGNPSTFYPAIPELTVDKYQAGITNYKAFSDIAIVNIGRSAGEGQDLPSGKPGEFKDQSGKGKEVDYLELSKNEQDLIKLCEENFGTVIVCLNAANPLELGILNDEKIDAAIWIGHPGSYGLSEVAKVIRGDVNPSGRTVDTYAYDNQEAPAYRNASYAYTYKYSNLNGYYVDYQEGIYVGYRYYETKYLNDEEGYKKSVQYPFGYGLSYTDFEWTMKEYKADDSKITVTVNVKNVGDMAGKDVVEVYYSAPYTNGGIEKSAIALGDFAKTSLLEPGKDEDVTLTFPVSDMASYDYDDANGNGHKGYELEAGDYVISVRSDVHTNKLDNKTYNVPETKYFDKSSTGYDIKNQFENSKGGINQITRADNFTSNFPTTDILTPREADQSVVDAYNNQEKYDSDPNDPKVTTGTITKYVDKEKRDENGEIVKDENGNVVYETEIDDNGNETRAKRGLYLSDMAGLSYDDPLWEDLLNQLTVDEMANLIANGGYMTDAVPSINKGINRDLDGPQGFNFSNVSIEKLKAMSYPSEIVLASTWNKELAYKEGESFGAEANELGVTSVYAPAVNIHRTPYGGRNFEYYSEDPLLSGYMGEKFVEGANTQGLNCYVKHFAVNDQETQRYGLFTWVDEQSIREIYLKPFQMTVELGKTRAIMSSFNRIGATWSGAHYGLLTNVLRNEWGFQGMVLTDYYINFQKFMDPNAGLRAGNDCWLTGFTALGKKPDLSSNTSQKYARQACHNILFAVANARAKTVTLNEDWLKWFIPVDVILWLGVLAWAGVVIWKGISWNKKGKDEKASSKEGNK